MPLYDYDCANCRGRFEVIHGVHADPPANCPLCGGGPVRKAITAAAVHYRGSGWAKKERRVAAPAGSSSKAGDGTGDGGSDGGSSSTASESTATATKESSDAGSGSNAKDAKDAKDSKAKPTTGKSTSTGPKD